MAQLFSLGSYARHMKDEQSEPPPLSERVFDYWFVTLPWIVCTGALVVFVGMPFARMLVVCWFKGTDAYFHQGIRIPKSKHPLHFTDGSIVPELPYFLGLFRNVLGFFHWAG